MGNNLQKTANSTPGQAVWDYPETALESARKYYSYLESENKGVAVFTVEKVENGMLPGFFQFYLDKRPFGSDSLTIWINDVPLKENQGKVVELVNNSRIVSVWLNDQYAAAISKLAAKKDAVKVVSDLKFLIKRLGKWYKQYGARIAFPQAADEVKCFHNKKAKNTPSPDQRSAIEGVLSLPFTYVWGAPGTGKTQCVLANAVLSFAAEKKQVLLTAPTNNAVDQMLNGVLPVMQEAGFNIGKTVIRCGIPSSQFASAYPGVCQTKAFSREFEALNKKIFETKEILKECDEKLKRFEAYHAFESEFGKFKAFQTGYPDLLQSLEDISSSIAKYENENVFLSGKIELEKDELEAHTGSRKKQTDRIAELTEKVRKNRDSLWRKLGFVNFERLQSELDAAVSEEEKHRQLIKDLTLKIKKLEKEKESNNKHIRENLRNFERVRKELLALATSSAQLASQAGKLDPKTFSQAKTSLQNFIKKLASEYKDKSQAFSRLDMAEEKALLSRKAAAQKAIAEYEARKKEITVPGKDKQPEDCLVVACTVDYCLANILPDDKAFHFAHIFLDEAGYCSLIKGCTLLGYGKPVTFLGDHKQLPPVCEMNDPQFKEAGNWPVFLFSQSVLHVEDVLFDSTEVAYRRYMDNEEASFTRLLKFDLLESYRFGDSLAKILAGEVYSADFHGQKHFGTLIHYIDAPKFKGRDKRTNLAETASIQEYLSSPGAAGTSVGILTPYTNQRKLLKEVAKTCRLPMDSVVTVHGSQGREWDTVILSVVDTSDKYFTDTRNIASNGLNLINTAVSRAKKELIIVCDYHYWIKQKDQLICKLLEKAEKLSW